MVDFAEEFLVAKAGTINPNERDFLSSAFSNLISSKRHAWRSISALEQNPKYSKFHAALLAYKTQIYEQRHFNCHRIIDIINNRILSNELSDENKAFFLKMVGDYSRYIVENAKDA